MEKFVEERLSICKQCAIMRLTEFGMKCDDRKWLDVENNVSSSFNHDGWIRGCGCYCSRKATKLTNHCVADKW